MRSLVTGGAGFIGSALVRELLQRGNEVVVLDNDPFHGRHVLPPEADLIVADLRDAPAVADACRGAEIVYHLGAVRSVPRSVDDPVLTMECNVGGTLNVLMAAQAAGSRRVVYASSSSVYGEGSEIQREDAPLVPLSPYAVSKLAGEHYCRVWSTLHGLPTISLRYFNVFGPGQFHDSRYANVFPEFIDALLEGRPPVLHWDGEQSRDFTFIDDVVRATILSGESDICADGGAINVAAGAPTTIKDVLRAVSDAVGRWIEPAKLPRRPGDVRRTHADISKAHRVLGWRPEVPWDEAVGRTVAWFRESTVGSSEAKAL